MTETSRVTTTAHALGLALDALADALAHVRHEAIAASAAVIDSRVGEFRAAVAGASASGDALPPARARALSAALARCRRLGVSLSLLTGQPGVSLDVPRGYTPVGRPLSQSDGGTFLTARG